MASKILRLREKPLDGILHGYSLSVSPSIGFSNQAFGDLERVLLQPWCKKMKIDRPIFIVGPYRSGTSVLEEIITRHPKVGYFSYTTNVYYRAPILGNLVTRLLRALGVLDKEPIYTLHNPRLLATVLSPSECEWVWSQSKSNLWDPKVTDLTADADFSDPVFEDYIKSMIKRHLLLCHAVRFENKNPVNSLRMEYLHKLFPDACFINIVRNPMDTVLSHYRTSIRVENVFNPDPKTKRAWEEGLHIDLLSKQIKTRNYAQTAALDQEHRLLGISHQWAEMQSAVLEATRTNPNLASQFLDLRYEDLVARPVDTLNTVWRFIDLEDEHANRITQKYLTNLSAPQEKAPSIEEQKYMSRIRETVSPVATRLGYSL